MKKFNYVLCDNKLMKIVAVNNNEITVERISKRLTRKIARKTCDYYQAQQLGYALYERRCFPC